MSYKFYKTAFLQSKEEVKKMNNKLSRMLALAMAGALVLSGCGGSEQGGNTNSEGGSASAEENSKELASPTWLFLWLSAVSWKLQHPVLPERRGQRKPDQPGRWSAGG